MNYNINLLDPLKKKTTTKEMRRLYFFRLFAFCLLFIVSLVSVTLFILVMYSPLPALQKKEQSLRSTLSQSNQDMLKLAFLNERVNSIDLLLQKRVSLDKYINLIQSKLDDATKITSIRVNRHTLFVIVESRSLKSLDSFLNNMIAYVKEKNGFSQVVMTDLALSPSKNVYSLTINLVII